MSSSCPNRWEPYDAPRRLRVDSTAVAAAEADGRISYHPRFYRSIAVLMLEPWAAFSPLKANASGTARTDGVLTRCDMRAGGTKWSRALPISVV
jgi:hypothetical protein